MGTREHRKRVLAVNCYFDDTRLPVPRRGKLMQATAPIYLAGAFNQRLCEVRLYNEQYDGPIPPEQLAWPDLLVLSGLTNSLDRMLHLTAYARTQNPNVIVAAGGPAIRALPFYSRQFFDYACEGDVEEMQDVVRDCFGPQFVSEDQVPRFELANWMKNGISVETSRNCNFRCSFCTTAAERKPYQIYPDDVVRRDVRAAGYSRLLVITDNNLYGSAGSFPKRAALLRALHDQQCFDRWGACVTGDFFLNPRNLELARESGCIALFSGVESFDEEWLRSMNKLQNTVGDAITKIDECLSSGILFLYGLMLDVTVRSVEELRRELDAVMSDDRIPFPTFFSIPVPFPRTRFFYDCLDQGLILPNTRWRDLDSTTISLRTLSPLSEAAGFVRGVQWLRGYWLQVVRHTISFCRAHPKLDRLQYALVLSNVWQQANYRLRSQAVGCLRGTWPHRRTHVSTTEMLDATYRPTIRLSSIFKKYFRPTRLTDASGCLVDELLPDLGTKNDNAFQELAQQSQYEAMQAPDHVGAELCVLANESAP